MDCRLACERIGPYLDAELPTDLAGQLEEHMEACPACRTELEQIRTTIDRLRDTDPASGAKAPPQLWSAIKRRLDGTNEQPAQVSILHVFRRPLAAAASLGILIGAATFLAIWLSPGGQVAHATMIDYSMLLDGLAEDVDAAVERFFSHYQGELIDPEQAATSAPELSFAVPPELPGGYRLEQAYRLQFGKTPGVAARYRSADEPLVVFFHPPVDKTRMGLHRDSHCQVAGRDGHRVEVGAWQLIHFTDPTTCHCLLSTLDEESEILAVMEQIAPAFSMNTVAPMDH